MRNTNSRSLPSWIEETYEILVGADDFHDGMSREHAHELLLSHEKFEDDPADAEYALKRLLERGWLYEVDEGLFVTEPNR